MLGRFNKFVYAIVLGMIFHPVTMAANGFATQRLQRMAGSLRDVSFSELNQGTHNEFSHAGHPLTIRVNEWKEVEHIGYRLFDSLAKSCYPQLACDFAERYLLELDLDNETDRQLRMGIDKVIVEDGSLDNLHLLPLSDMINVSMVEMRRYRVSWHLEKHCLLSLVFDMDYQLLSGCNSIELEYNYLRSMNRLQAKSQWPENDIISDTTDEYAIVDGGHYLSESIRGDRYYQRDSVGIWKLVCNSEKPYWSAANLMLTPINILGDYLLNCQLDMYGYRDTTFCVNLAKWIAQTLSEECQMYFGIKSRTPKTIRGTLFCPNKSAGYCHMMSVEIPIASFDEGQGVVKGRLFTYVPLHNIDEGYFDLDYIKPEDKKKQQINH